MHADHGTSDIPWREWDIREWNRALFEHFLRRRTDSTPIRRFIATPSELKRVAGDEDATPTEVHKQFALVIRQRLRARQMSLCTDALSLEWNPRSAPGSDIPPFFAHLMLTCVVASVAGKEGRPVKDFRHRLNRLLGRSDAGNCRYPLNRLPQLWEMLRDWLATSRRDGGRYRELILPDSGHRKLIGYSYWLAFPAHRDRVLLSQLLADQAASPPPDVARIVELLDAHRDSFTRAFQRELEEFGEAVRTGRRIGLEAHPFWISVLDSMPLLSAASPAPPKAGRLLVRLDLGADRGFVLSMLTDRPPDTDLGVVRARDAGEFAVGEYVHFLASDFEDGGGPSAAHLLLGGDSTLDAAWFCPSSTLHAIKRGLLLFAVGESGAWVSTGTCPGDGEEVRALVREPAIAPLLAGLRDAGARPIVTSSHYPGWAELRAFSGRHVATLVTQGVTELGVTLRHAGNQEPLSLRDGVPLSRGWLGSQRCLPSVVAARGTVTLFEGSTGSEAQRTPLVTTAEESRVWSFPERDWGGSFVLQAEEGQRVVARRRIVFRRRADGHAFRSAARPDQWFQEGGTRDSEDALHDPLPATPIPDGIALGRPAADREGCLTADVAVLVEAFAGLACHRRGIEEAEVHRWFDRLLGVSGRLRRDVVRAWVEHGSFDRLVSRRWRRCLYVPRQPRFILVQRDPGIVEQAVLEGLFPEATRERVEQAVGALGGRLLCRGSSPWVPPSWRVRLASVEQIEEVSRRAGLRTPVVVQPGHLTLASLSSVAAERSDLQRHHTPAGVWDWTAGQFRGRARTNTGIEVEQYRRKDVPDAYVVWGDGESLWHSRSRTWALLIGAWHRGETPFLSTDPNGLRRVPGIGLYLPLPAGRLAALTGDEPPGPVETRDGHDYRYAFGSSRLRDTVLQLLWPVRLADEVLGRARWLAACLRSPLGGARMPLPQTVQGTLRRHSSVSPIAELARHRWVPRALWPHILTLCSSLRRVDGEGVRSP